MISYRIKIIKKNFNHALNLKKKKGLINKYYFCSNKRCLCLIFLEILRFDKNKGCLFFSFKYFYLLI